MATTKATPALAVHTFKGSELIKAAVGTSRDVLCVVLQPNRCYTEEEVKRLADKFLSKEVPKNGRR